MNFGMKGVAEAFERRWDTRCSVVETLVHVFSPRFFSGSSTGTTVVSMKEAGSRSSVDDVRHKIFCVLTKNHVIVHNVLIML